MTVLLQDELFNASGSFREQCFHACRVLREEHQPVVPYSVIGMLFRVSKGTIRKEWKRFQKDADNAASGGRPPILTSLQVQTIVEQIHTAYERKNPFTIKDICNFASESFRVDVLPNTMRHILARVTEIKRVTAIPMDDKRVAVSIEAIRDHFARLCATVSGAPAHFVFNMDEMGHQTWADAPNKKCYVPTTHPGHEVPYPVPRTGKRITLVACVAADGSFLKPTIIIPRKTIDLDLYTLGLTPEKVEIFQQCKGYIDRPFFDEWVAATFVLELERRRQQWQYSGPAVLMLDNCTAHQTPQFAEICESNQILPIFLPPHSSNQLQVLDLSVFGVTKRIITRINCLEAVNVQSKHISDVVNAFFAAAIPINIVKSFRRAGISLIVDPDEHVICQITPETARCLIEPEALCQFPAVPDEEDDECDPDFEVFIKKCGISHRDQPE
jgi:hypothetical protein